MTSSGVPPIGGQPASREAATTPPIGASTASDSSAAAPKVPAGAAGTSTAGRTTGRSRLGRRLRLLDLYCCRGGGAKGYAAAGWEVVGVDIEPQPLYPYEFHQDDALEVLRVLLAGGTWRGYRLEDFDAIHASPPCQAFTVYGNNSAHVHDDHPNLIPATREALEATRLPYVIENVGGARDELRDPVQICGTGLGVRVRRHRLFETNWPLVGVPCDHGRFTDRIFPGSSNRPNGRTVMNVGEYRVPIEVQRQVMDMPWSDLYGISQAIPPAYTQHIGAQLAMVATR